MKNKQFKRIEKLLEIQGRMIGLLVALIASTSGEKAGKLTLEAMEELKNEYTDK